MKKHINILLHPNRLILLIYGVFSFVFLLGFIWLYSFSFYFQVGDYNTVLLAALIVLLFLASIFDRRYGSNIKKYIITTVAQLILLWIVSDPIRTWQINSSLEHSKIITNSLKAYKSDKGTYPITLVELSKQQSIDLPNRTNLGTKYWYKRLNQQDYQLEFRSYYGYYYSYSIKDEAWYCYD